VTTGKVSRWPVWSASPQASWAGVATSIRRLPKVRCQGTSRAPATLDSTNRVDRFRTTRQRPQTTASHGDPRLDLPSVGRHWSAGLRFTWGERRSDAGRVRAWRPGLPAAGSPTEKSWKSLVYNGKQGVAMSGLMIESNVCSTVMLLPSTPV